MMSSGMGHAKHLTSCHCICARLQHLQILETVSERMGVEVRALASRLMALVAPQAKARMLASARQHRFTHVLSILRGCNLLTLCELPFQDSALQIHGQG